MNLIDTFLGTIKTDNQIGFDNGTITRIAVFGFIAAVGAGLATKALAKLFNI